MSTPENADNLNPEWVAIENKPHGELLLGPDSFRPISLRPPHFEKFFVDAVAHQNAARQIMPHIERLCGLLNNGQWGTAIYLCRSIELDIRRAGETLSRPWPHPPIAIDSQQRCNAHDTSGLRCWYNKDHPGSCLFLL